MPLESAQGSKASLGREDQSLMQKDVYSKKITSEEEQKRFVLVLKDRLSFFPSEGKTFRLIQNGQPKKARVESYPCACRGPEEPHSHYFVKTRGLKAGDRVIIQRDANGTARYFLQVKHHPHRS
jgi:hypothetical protein